MCMLHVCITVVTLMPMYFRSCWFIK
jgi:hypothetical protein